MKRFALMLLLACCILLLGACASGGAHVDVAAVKSAILEQTNISEPLELKTERVAELYGIAPGDIAESACFVTLSGAFPDEIILIDAADEDAAARVAQKLEAHLAEVKNQARDYDAQSYAQLEKCVVQRSGTSVALFISAQAETMRAVFTEQAKG